MKLKLATILSLFFAAGLPDIAAACSCAGLDPPTQFAISTAVFSGSVIAAQPVAVQQNAGQGQVWQGQEIQYQVRVDRVWKGGWTLPPVVDVYSIGSGTSCGYSMSVGQDYLIYTYSTTSNITQEFFHPASWPELGRSFAENPGDFLAIVSDGTLRTGMCTRTTTLDQAAEDLAFLGPGSPPTGGHPLILGSLAALSAVVIVAWRWRRGRGAIPE